MVGEQQPWLDVPFREKDAAKAAGARWDPRVRRWYAPRPGMAALTRWLPTAGDAAATAADPVGLPSSSVPVPAPRMAPGAAQVPAAAPAPTQVEPWWAWVDDPWTDLADRPPGLGLLAEAARRRAAGDSDGSWRAGADGEAMLADSLAGLTHPRGLARFGRASSRSARWRVLHSVPLGPDGRHGDIDHVLIGPPGVITINAKHHAARRRVEVTAAGMTVGGRPVEHVAKARREADRVHRLLTGAAAAHVAALSPTATTAAGGHNVGDEAPAWPPDLDPVATAAVATGHRPDLGPGAWPPVLPAIAVVGAPLHGRERPAGVLVATPKELPRWLTALPAALDEDHAAAVYALARRSSTWARTL